MKQRWLFTSGPTFRGGFIGIVCALVCLAFNPTPIVRSLENQALDLCFAARGTRSTNSRVVIVGLDDKTLDCIRKPLMYFSPEIANVIQYLSESGVSAIGLDFFISNQLVFQPSIISENGEGYAVPLGVAARNAGTVVFPVSYRRRDDDESLRGSLISDQMPLLTWTGEYSWPQDWSRFGYVVLDRSESAVRRQQLWMTTSEGPKPYFPASIFFTAQDRPQDMAKSSSDDSQIDSAAQTDPDEEKLNRQRVFDSFVTAYIPAIRGFEENHEILINYVGPPKSFQTVSFVDILHAANPTADIPNYEPDATAVMPDWEDAIVLIGNTATLSPDIHPTPFSNLTLPEFLRLMRTNQRAEFMAGVEIHANTIATLEDQAFITTPWLLSTPVLLILFGATMGIALTRLSLQWGAMITFLHHWIWKGVSIAAFSFADWRVEMVSMLLLGGLLYSSVFALRWRWLRRMMGLIKSEAIARTLEMDPRSLMRVGEEREVTVFFSDIRNFTSFSANHSAREVVQLLNNYFATIVPQFEAHGGVLNQYMGDGVMVIFGAPEKQPDQALRAVRAAIATVKEVHRHQSKWKELGVEDFRIGVGVHTGKAVVGTVGSPNRLDYSAIGNTVNTAARIEAATKELTNQRGIVTEILISKATLEAIPESERTFPYEGPFQLQPKGITEGVSVYAVPIS